MNKLRGLCLLLAACSCALAQRVTVSGSNIQDSAGNKLASGTITFTPVNNTGQSISYRLGSGGPVLTVAVSANVVNGAFSISLPDTSATVPAHVCFAVSVSDGFTDTLLGPGYGCVQPSSAADGASWCSGGVCNLDSYTPNQAAIAVVQKGPKGDKGDTGSQGPQGTPGTVTVNPVSGSAANILAGTIFDAVGASNLCGYGSGVGWLQYMFANNPYFKGRVTYKQSCALGWAPSDEMTAYTNNFKTDCTAHAGTATPTVLYVESNVNGYTGDQAQYNAIAAIWAQARSDGCVVAASTPSDYYTSPPASFVAMIRAGTSDLPATGKGMGGNPVNPRPYDMLFDLFAVLPYDGCTNTTDGSCPYNSTGHFADTGHFNQGSLPMLGDYAACVYINRGCGGGVVRSVNWTPASLYGSALPVNNKDGMYVEQAGAAGGVLAGVWQFGSQGSGTHFSYHNTATTPGAILIPYINPGLLNAVFADTGSQYDSANIGPGETFDYLYDVPPGATQGVFHRIHRSIPAPAYQPLGTNIVVSTSNGTEIPGYADIFDCAGYSVNVTQGPNGAQSSPYHRVTIIDSSATACTLNAASVPINGSGSITLGGRGLMTGVYLSQAAGWLIH